MRADIILHKSYNSSSLFYTKTAVPRYSPQDIRIVGTSSSTVKLSWKSVPLSDRPYLYNILIQEIAGSDGSVAKERSVNVLTSFTTVLLDKTVRDLLPNRIYKVKIRAVNVVGSGLFSQPAIEFRTERLSKL